MAQALCKSKLGTKKMLVNGVFWSIAGGIRRSIGREDRYFYTSTR